MFCLCLLLANKPLPTGANVNPFKCVVVCVFVAICGCDQGLAVAQENLGFMYRDGQGVPQDDVETYAWFSVAAGDRFPNAAKGRDLTASKLTPEQLSQGQKRATELLEKISGGK